MDGKLFLMGFALKAFSVVGEVCTVWTVQTSLFGEIWADPFS